MSSSSVHVREIRNESSEGELQFSLQCDTNGIDMPQIEGEPPKDHTYNKDPSVDQVKYSNSSAADKKDETLMDENGSPKKGGRIMRNVKHKFIKEKTKSQVEKVVGKKNIRKKPAPKSNAKSDPQRSDEAVSDRELQEVNNVSTEPSSKGNRNRKRKAETNKDEVTDTKVAKDSAESLTKKTEPVEMKEEKIVKARISMRSRGKATVPKTTAKKESKVKAAVSKKELPIKVVPKTKLAEKKRENTIPDTGPPLPKGWTRKIVVRKSGKTAGDFDIYIYSPDGVKLRSRPDVAAYLAKIKSDLKVEDFNFTKRGLGITSPVKSSENQKKSKADLKQKKTANTIQKSQKLLVKIKSPNKKVSNTKNTKVVKKTPPKKVPDVVQKQTSTRQKKK